MNQVDDDQQGTEPVAVAASDIQAGAGPEAMPIALEVADCPGAKRMIGILDSPDGDCSLGQQLPSTWNGSALFATGSPGVDGLTQPLPNEFERLCAFDYVGPHSEATASDYTSLFGVIDNDASIPRGTVAADCRGEFEQGDLYDASVGAELRQAFMSNVDWDMGAQVDLDHDSREHVEVAVLDTVSQAVADDPQLSPANAHGLQMTALIREIDCPAGRAQCNDRIHNVMAMPRQDWTSPPAWSAGGSNGTQGDLALAVYESTQSWRQRRLADPSGAAPRLVLNLSLGWSRLASQSLDPSRGPGAALMLAMEHASCNGALMLAAAGNTEDELCPQLYPGPLAPASFEDTPAPTQGECAGLGFAPDWAQTHPVFGDPGDYAPLVHAVGGLDEFDAPLINARQGGMPRLAALGAEGLASSGQEALAGTSVSTAVASATAAFLWSYRPELTAHQIMQIIYDSGWDTGASADFGLTGVNVAVRRISVCAAVDAACTGQGAACPTPACVATAPASDGYLAGFVDAVGLVLADPGTALDDYQTTAQEYAAVCVDEALPLTNLASPQPDIPICSRCSLALQPGETADDDQLAMTIDPVYAGQISGLRLITSTELGERSYRDFRPAVITSLNTQPELVDVTRVFIEDPDATAAALEFTLLSGRVQTNRIPVIAP